MEDINKRTKNFDFVRLSSNIKISRFLILLQVSETAKPRDGIVTRFSLGNSVPYAYWFRMHVFVEARLSYDNFPIIWFNTDTHT